MLLLHEYIICETHSIWPTTDNSDKTACALTQLTPSTDSTAHNALTICTCTDHSTSSSKPYTIIFFECYMILFFTIFVTKLCWDWMYLLNYDKYHPEELVYDDNALAAKLKWTLGLITTIWWRTTLLNGSTNDGRWSEIAAELLVLQSHYSRRRRWWWISVVRCSLWRRRGSLMWKTIKPEWDDEEARRR